MKPTINQGDGPKIALLVVAVVVVFGLAIRSVIARQSSAPLPAPAAASTVAGVPSPPPPTGTAPAVPLGPGPATDGTGVAVPDLWAQVDRAGESLPAGFRDPFKAPPSGTPDPTGPGLGRKGMPTEPSVPTVQVSEGHRPTGGPAILPTFGSQPGGLGTQPATPVAVTPPELLLKGVVSGNPPVAVIKVGDRILQAEPGLRLPDGSSVIRINADGIILQHGGKRVRLDVGSSQPVEISMVRTIAASARVSRPRPAAPPPGPAVLVRDGQPVAGIIVAPDAPDVVVYAAGRLRSYIEQVTGAALPILDHRGNGLAIFVGPSQYLPKHGLRMRGLRDGGFRIVCRSDFVAIYGRDLAGTHVPGASDPWMTVNDQAGRDLVAHSGTLQGVYRFLETACGVRWNVGSEVGPTIPTLATISVTSQTISIPHGMAERFASVMVRDRLPSASVAVIRAAIARTVYRPVAGQV